MKPHTKPEGEKPSLKKKGEYVFKRYFQSFHKPLGNGLDGVVFTKFCDDVISKGYIPLNPSSEFIDNDYYRFFCLAAYAGKKTAKKIGVVNTPSNEVIRISLMK